MTIQPNLFEYEYADLTSAEADVYRRWEDGRTPSDIAADTHRARSTVRTLLSRARRKRGEAEHV